MTIARLRQIPVLADLSDAELTVVATGACERELQQGDYLFRQGERATAFQILLEGELETTRDVGGEQVLMLRHGPGGYLGALALLTDTPYRGSTFAVGPARVLEIPQADFQRLVSTHPPLLREFLSAVEAVSGAIKGIERDREKLLAVGQLAAGLAHELNNPAAAAVRSVVTLHRYERERHEAFGEIAMRGAPTEQLAALVGLSFAAIGERGAGQRLDPLAASDREQELAMALEQRGVPDGWTIASALTEVGMDADMIDRVVSEVGEENLAAGLRFVASSAGVRVLLAELEEATTRVANLVNAFRTYSFLDQGARQSVDVHEGLESTLVLLGHKLREKQVEIIRVFDPGLPQVEAAGSELNQVWTNLIDNAIDAVDVGGRLTLRTEAQGDRVLVEIADDGPGIPEDVQPRVFDAFFTTKPVGKGTGLGLDIAQRIVVRHHGEIRLASAPGDTRFQVVMPVR